MEALFIVPAMVSPQVNEKLIPALSKLIERNILLNNASLFKNAATAKYSRFASWKKTNENSIPVTVISDSFINENNSFLHEFGKFVIQEAKSDYYSKQFAADVAALRQMKKDLQSQITVGMDARDAAITQQNIVKVSELITQAEQERVKADNMEAKAEMDFATAKRNADNHMELQKLIQASKDKAKDPQETELEIKSTMASIGKLVSDTAKNWASTKQIKDESKDRKKAIKAGKRAKSAEVDTFRGHSFGSLDSVEQPSGIQFFNQISLEPTILEIPLYIGRDNSEQKMIRVGVKCVPYVIDDVSSIIKLLNETKNMNWFERQFKNALRKVNTKIWFTKRRAINKGDAIDPGEAVEAIMYSPNRSELTNTTSLARKFTNKDSSSWSTMIILSSYDLDQNEALVDIVNNYRKLTKYVVGDLVITNETKESAYFCTPRLNHCQEIPFDYLKKILNLKDVLDYSEASRASAWSKEVGGKTAPIKTAISETTNYTELKNKIEDILKGY